MGNRGEYKLQVLLKLRGQERELAEESYAEAMAVHRALSEKVRRLKKEHGAMIEVRRQKCRAFDEEVVANSLSVAEINGFDHHLQGLRAREEEIWDKVEMARDEERQARRRMELAHRELVEAVRQLKAVEKHQEKWSAQKALEEQRRASTRDDELAARVWREQQST